MDHSSRKVSEWSFGCSIYARVSIFLGGFELKVLSVWICTEESQDSLSLKEL